MRVFVTADLHHGIEPALEPLTDAIAAWCAERAQPGDVLVLGGDNACRDAKGLADCLDAFREFPGAKTFVPGNHDLWSDPGRGLGSDVLYQKTLAELGRAHGFHLLDEGPRVYPFEGGALGLAGSFGGHDFSLSDLAALDEVTREEVREGWRTGRFRHVFWNDYRFLWRADGRPWDHAAFAVSCLFRLRGHLQALDRDPAVTDIVCVTHTGATLEQVWHHPVGEGKPLEGNLWFLGLAGVKGIGDAVRATEKARLHICGHTHHVRDVREPGGLRFLNLGCDYPKKRALCWDARTREATWSPWFEAPDTPGSV